MAHRSRARARARARLGNQLPIVTLLPAALALTAAVVSGCGGGEREAVQLVAGERAWILEPAASAIPVEPAASTPVFAPIPALPPIVLPDPAPAPPPVPAPTPAPAPGILGTLVEQLDRGAVAVPSGRGMLVSWRLLAGDAVDLGFNVYRDGMRLNGAPLVAATNFLDVGGHAASSYSVRPVSAGVEGAPSSVLRLAAAHLRVPISQPEGGTTPDGVAYTYEANDGSVADLDGDGQYEIVLKWLPTNAKDNAHAGHTGPVLLDAYKLDGTRLWRIDLGRNIRAGSHYNPFVAFDLDGDGQAELMVKTADGTVDGAGQPIGDVLADHRNASGYVLDGPEYLTVFNGRTGAAMASTGYAPLRGRIGDWGDHYGNRVDRFLAGVAYLDGERPSAVFSRGYYGKTVVVAWDWRDGQLKQRWLLDSSASEAARPLAGQGAHWFAVSDVDGDGKQDIVYGAATINSDGTLRYSTGLGHGDALHVGVHDPVRGGRQVFMVHESPSAYQGKGMEMHDAATGQVLWGLGSEGDVGRGVCFDIDPAFPGNECWAVNSPNLYSASGQTIAASHPGQVNFGLWWDGDLGRELLDGAVIDKWSPEKQSTTRLLTAYQAGVSANNGSKATPVLTADLLGDWREEVIYRSTSNDALLVFVTPHETAVRMPTLMQDPQYRVQVAGQNMGYNQPPHPGFHLGHGMTLPVVFPKVRTERSASNHVAAERPL